MGEGVVPKGRPHTRPLGAIPGLPLTGRWAARGGGQEGGEGLQEERALPEARLEPPSTAEARLY